MKLSALRLDKTALTEGVIDTISTPPSTLFERWIISSVVGPADGREEHPVNKTTLQKAGARKRNMRPKI
jgi:hypothetical protein